MKKIILALFLLLALSAPARAADVFIDGVTVSEAGGGIKVSFTLKGAFSDEIVEAINSGIPTSFRFIVELDRTRRFWFDRTVARWEFKHSVNYDTLKQEYEITLQERGRASLKTRDRSEMKRLMASVTDLAIDVPSLGPGHRYELRIMAELRTIKLPFRLDSLLFFLRFWDIKTGWYTYRFSF